MSKDSAYTLSNNWMMTLGGFITALGIAAVAVAFTVLNAATLGIAGLVVAGIGVTALLAGVGIFGTGASRKFAEVPESMDDQYSRELELEFEFS